MANSAAGASDSALPRIVVCALGGDYGFLQLPESRVSGDRGFVSGGERAMYELATAAAVLGYDVELRGDLNRAVLAQLTEAAGAAPTVGLASRPIATGEVVVLPEAADLRIFAAVHLSGARPLMMVLAPPGLSGWSFGFNWHLPDPLTVPVDAVGTPASYRAIAALGYEMWTLAQGLADPGNAAGAPVRWIGTGNPVPYPEPVEKTHDIAVVESNRWASWANELAEQVPGASILRVAFRRDVYSLCADLAPARILMWPSRLEGRSRIAREARAVGTVPVALDTNPFATVDDHGGGVVLLDRLEDLPVEAARLLAAPDELATLADEARRSVREQTAWAPFVDRVQVALGELVAKPLRDDAEARNELGVQLRGLHDELLAPAADAARRGAEANVVLEASVERHLADLAAARAEAAEAHSEAARANARAEAAEAVAAAYRSRRIVRLVDQGPLRRVVGPRRPGGTGGATPPAGNGA